MSTIKGKRGGERVTVHDQGKYYDFAAASGS